MTALVEVPQQAYQLLFYQSVQAHDLDLQILSSSNHDLGLSAVMQYTQGDAGSKQISTAQ